MQRERGMGQVIVRNLDETVIAEHRRRARARGVSLEQQLREVLSEAARPSRAEALAHADARQLPHRGRAGARGPRRALMLIVDASVLVPLLVAEPGSVAARVLAAAEPDLLAPELILAATLNVLWQKQRLGQIDDAARVEAVGLIGPPLLALAPTPPLALRASDRARELDHPAYDCRYLALAEREAVPLVTDDRRLRALAAGLPALRIIGLEEAARMVGQR
jgi:predicted nucleic acid-binding protein/plasmid stability protein